MEGMNNSRDTEARREAVLRLGNRPEGIDAGEFARLLLRALKDRSWRVRKTAVDILLEKYPPESYMSGLIDLLYIDDNAGARNSAIEALTRLGRKATDRLTEAYDAANSDVRKFIIDISGEVRDERTLPILIRAVHDEDENVRASAIEHLGSVREPSVVDALLEMLGTGDFWTAYPAAEALGRIGDVRAVPGLVSALKNRALREPAIRALGRLGDDKTLYSMVPYVDDRSKAVRHEALCALETFYRNGMSGDLIAQALRKHFGRRLTDVLLENAQSPRADVKVSSILLLGLLKDERALGPLLEMSADEKFADEVRKALVFIGREKPEALLPLFEQKRIELLRFICDVAAEVASPAFIGPLRSLLENHDGHIRALAIRGLVNTGDPGAVDLIKAFLADPYPDVQEAAVRALGITKDRLHVDEVINTLESENSVLRKNIALLLAEVGSKDAVAAIRIAMKDEEVMVRKAAVAALSKLKTGETLNPLTLALADEEPDIRAAAAHALGDMGDEAAFEPLCLLLSDRDDMVRVTAIKALGTLGDVRAVPELVALLSEDNGFVVTSAMESIGRLGGEEARRALTDMLFSEDREFRRTSIKALSGFENIENLILPFLKDEDWATRVSVVEALSSDRREHVRAEIEKLYDEEEDPVVMKALGRYLNA